MLLRLVGRPGELDAAGLAAATGLDLGLDDGHAAHLLGSRTSRLRGLGDDTQRGRYSMLGEELLRLKFHQVHESDQSFSYASKGDYLSAP